MNAKMGINSVTPKFYLLKMALIPDFGMARVAVIPKFEMIKMALIPEFKVRNICQRRALYG